MPQWRQYGPNILTSVALLGVAGAGAALAGVPGQAPTAISLLPLAAIGATAWWHHRRDRRLAARLRHLRLAVTLPAPPAAMNDQVLAFHLVAPHHWQARREGWQVSICHTPRSDLPWQLCVQPAGLAMRPRPVATAASMNAMLLLARGLLPGMASTGGEANLLDCDLTFPVAGFSRTGGDCLTALAEGGYALQVAHGCLAVAPERAERLLCRGDVIAAEPR
jgi:hypothetical protein